VSHTPWRSTPHCVLPSLGDCYFDDEGAIAIARSLRKVPQLRELGCVSARAPTYAGCRGRCGSTVPVGVAGPQGCTHTLVWGGWVCAEPARRPTCCGWQGIVASCHSTVCLRRAVVLCPWPCIAQSVQQRHHAAGCSRDWGRPMQRPLPYRPCVSVCVGGWGDGWRRGSPLLGARQFGGDIRFSSVSPLCFARVCTSCMFPRVRPATISLASCGPQAGWE
jgi:hypothetical protein